MDEGMMDVDAGALALGGSRRGFSEIGLGLRDVEITSANLQADERAVVFQGSSEEELCGAFLQDSVAVSRRQLHATESLASCHAGAMLKQLT